MNMNNIIQSTFIICILKWISFVKGLLKNYIYFWNTENCICYITIHCIENLRKLKLNVNESL